MKSIKEKSEEYTNGLHPSIRRMCNESFVDGANYVLEQIEEVTNICFDEELRKVIAQLKKNNYGNN